MSQRPQRLSLTAAQTWAWQLDRHEGPECAEISAYLDIRGNIDLSMFETALYRAITESEALCTRFETENAVVRQVVETPPARPLPLVDLRTEQDPAGCARRMMTERRGRVIDIVSGPPFDLTLLRVDDDRFFLWFRFHHAAIDGFGFQVFRERFTEIYSALEDRRAVPPCPLGSLSALIQEDAHYRDSDEFARDRQYWRRQIPDPSIVHSLSGETSSAAPVSGFLSESGALPAPVVSRLRILARRQRAPLPVVAMAALGLQLHATRDTRETVVEIPVPGRKGRIARSIPGMMTSALPLRLDLCRQMATAELLRHAVAHAQELLQHQRFPFTALPTELGITDVLALPQPPALNIINYEKPLSLGSHPASMHHISNGPVEDFAINVYPRADGEIHIDSTANPKLYEPADLTFHHRTFSRILCELADADSGTTVDTVLRRAFRADMHSAQPVASG